MNNDLNNNQHYITRSFIKKRFGNNEGFVQRFDVQNESWKHNASPRFVFSNDGYTQLLELGQPVDNSLEVSFGNLETQLEFILPALDDAATRKSTPIPDELFKDFCFYCAYLTYLSPFAKAKAPADFVMRLNMLLEHGNLKLLREYGFSEDRIAIMLKQHSDGLKFIIAGKDYLQYIFRVQFIQNCKPRAGEFARFTKWTVYNSPIELPISDIAIIDMPESKAANLYIWPISPDRVLIGRLQLGSPPPFYTTDSIIYGGHLDNEAAEDVREIICLSAIKSIACKNKMDIAGIRARAKARNVKFTKLQNWQEVISAGLKTFDKRDFDIAAVSKEEYKNYVYSFIRPAD